MSQKGLSVNALSLLADVHQSTFNSGLLGKRNIPNDTFERIAPHLGVTPERLTALADLDRIGGIERIRKHAPEVLEAGPAIETAPPKPTDPYADVNALFPADMKHPPTARELKVLAQLGDLAAWSLTPGEPLWQDAPSERWPEIKGALEAWRENQGGADSATR